MTTVEITGTTTITLIARVGELEDALRRIAENAEKTLDDPKNSGRIELRAIAETARRLLPAA